MGEFIQSWMNIIELIVHSIGWREVMYVRYVYIYVPVHIR